MYVDENECVAKCPWQKRLLADNVCFSECPFSHPYKVDYSDKCLTQCTGDNVIMYNTTKCITQSDCKHVEMKMVFDDRVCVTECPEDTLVYTTEKMCTKVHYFQTIILVTATLCFPVLVIQICIMCHGNFRIKRKLPDIKNVNVSILTFYLHEYNIYIYYVIKI